MTSFRTLATLAALLAVSPAADAQPIGPFVGPVGYSGGGISYIRSRGRSTLSINVGFARGYGYNYGGYYDPYLAPPVVRETRITVINVAPTVVYTPPPFFSPPPPPPDEEDVPKIRLPEGKAEVPPVPPQLPVPIPEPEKQKAPPDAPARKKEEPKVRPEREPAARPGPEADPRDEHTRLMRAGREAFRDGEYGRAAGRFRQAVRVDAAQPQPQFLLVQSLLMQRDYHEAYDVLIGALQKKPDWPTTKFRPRELYGDLDEYAELLRALEKTHAKHPDDPTLLLLRAYVLWFDGRKEQAAPLLRKALKVADRDAVECFLKALPDETS